MQGYGAAAPAAFVLLYTLLPLAIFPASLLTLAGGLAFGWKVGFLYVTLGANLCANLSFALTRLLGRALIVRLSGGKLLRFDAALARGAFPTVLVLRTIPVLPFNAVNYGAGLSRMAWRPYALASFLGMLPGTFAYTYLGGNLDPRRREFWFAVAGLLVLLTLALVYSRRRNR